MSHLNPLNEYDVPQYKKIDRSLFFNTYGGTSEHIHAFGLQLGHVSSEPQTNLL